MILAFGVRLGAVQSERIDGIDAVDRVELVRVLGQQCMAEPFDMGRPWRSPEHRLAGRVCGHRIGAEIMVE